MIHNNLPSTVQQVLFDKNVWWEHGQRSTMQQFLCEYCLDNSYSRGIHFQQHGAGQALVKLDATNINPEGKRPGLPVSGQYIGALYLCINFTIAHQILSDHAEKYVGDNVILRATTRQLNEEQRNLWYDSYSKMDAISEDTGNFLLDRNVHCTTFEGTAKNHVHIMHSEPTLFLCVKYDGSIVKLPDLDLLDKSVSADRDETVASKDETISSKIDNPARGSDDTMPSK